MTKSAYAEAAAAVSAKTAAPKIEESCCSARGCLLPGSLSGATMGGSERYCFVHQGAQFGDFAGITTRVNNRITLLRIAMRLTNAPCGWAAPPKLLDDVRANDGAHLLEEPYRTARQLGAHMKRALEKECRAPQRKLETPDQRTQAAADNWTPAGDLLKDYA